jgi:1,4-dihydroxy-2-naphthoyl-CoA hydrolase
VTTSPDALRNPFGELIGERLVEASADRVVAELQVTEALHQPHGIVHGGVYATLIETAASVGANVWLAGRGSAVGLSNATDFLRAVRDGRLRAVATPIQRGRTLQLWQVTVHDGDGTTVAHGKVKLMNLGGR